MSSFLQKTLKIKILYSLLTLKTNSIPICLISLTQYSISFTKRHLRGALSRASLFTFWLRNSIKSIVSPLKLPFLFSLMGWKLIRHLLTLPPSLLWLVIQYFFGGLKYRRYRNSLRNALKLKIFSTALAVGVSNGKWVIPFSNSTLIRKIVPLQNPRLVKNIPGWGEQYDANSIWLVKQPDRKLTDPVIIYSHGGGYFIQTSPSQIVSLMSVYHLLDTDKQKKTSILFLDYKLASRGHTLPTQLYQLHDTYSKLVSEGSSNILLMGDSAGGHLSIAYTQYLKTLSKSPLVYPRQLLLISPWVKLHLLPSDFVKGNSWVDNEKYDMIHHSLVSNVYELKQIVGTEDLNSLVTSPGGKFPMLRSDWSDITTFSSPDCDIFLVLGEDESFRTDILRWAKFALDLPWDTVKYGDSERTFKTENYEFERRNIEGQANLSAYVEPLGVHDGFFFFEDSASATISKSLKAGKKPSITDLKEKDYFAMVRLTRFLNETL